MLNYSIKDKIRFSFKIQQSCNRMFCNFNSRRKDFSILRVNYSEVSRIGKEINSEVSLDYQCTELSTSIVLVNTTDSFKLALDLHTSSNYLRECNLLCSVSGSIFSDTYHMISSTSLLEFALSVVWLRLQGSLLIVNELGDRIFWLLSRVLFFF